MSDSLASEVLPASPRPTSPTPDVFVSPNSSEKRKREKVDQSARRFSRETKKRKKGHVRKLEQEQSLERTEGLNDAIGKMDSSLLADHIAKSRKRFTGDLSFIEQEDSYLSVLIEVLASAISDTSDWDSPRTLDGLPSYIEHYDSVKFGSRTDRLTLASRLPGSPHTLVITLAGLRAADITRALRRFQKDDAVVAKLFAKHIKLREAVDMLKTTRVNFGVGTPVRINELLDSGALSLRALERIVVDCSYIDQKKRGILDMRETQEPLIRLVNRPELKHRYGIHESDVQLLFY